MMWERRESAVRENKNGCGLNDHSRSKYDDDQISKNPMPQLASSWTSPQAGLFASVQAEGSLPNSPHVPQLQLEHPSTRLEGVLDGGRDLLPNVPKSVWLPQFVHAPA
jgi:hypothetical protein